MKSLFRSKLILLLVIAAAIIIPISISAKTSRAATAPHVRSDFYVTQRPPTLTFLGKYTPTAHFACQSPTAQPRCFGPQDFYKAYNINPLLNKGINGKGRTIVILDANQAPTIAHDLHVFDTFFGLPDPTLNIFTPEGTPNPTNDATETTLDVELAHAAAPGATIDLVLAHSLSNVDILNATAFIVKNNLGDVFSASLGENESADPAFVQGMHQLFVQAAAHHTSLFVSSGDTGAAQISPTTGLPVLAVAYPASDPLVTSVGGTALYVNSKGQYAAETTWNNSNLSTPAGVNDDTSGGFSVVFSRPSYQNGVHGIGNFRGVPDVAYDADNVNSGAIIICSSCGGGADAVGLAGGTSAAAPQWAGIAALAGQVAGKRLGFLNPAIYANAQKATYSKFFRDVQIGNNTYDFEINGTPGQVVGYSTQKGWDPATGWGSPNVYQFVIEITE